MASILSSLITTSVVVSQLVLYCTCLEVYLAARQQDFDDGSKTLSLTCYYEQKPEIIVFLLRNGTILTSNNHIIDSQLKSRPAVQLTSDTNKFELQMNATHADNGLYECCKFESVEHAEEPMDNRLNSCSGEYIDTRHQYPSEIQPTCLPAEVVQARIDTRVTLLCTSKIKDPDASIQMMWITSNDSIATNNEVVVKTGDSVISNLTLSVNYADISDVYTCAISDSAGIISLGKCLIYVNITWPSITFTMHRAENETIFVCDLTFPVDAPIIWSWYTVPTIDSSHISISNNTATILWSPAPQPNDVGSGERIYFQIGNINAHDIVHLCCQGSVYNVIREKCIELNLVQFKIPTVPNSTDTVTTIPGMLDVTDTNQDSNSSSKWKAAFCVLFIPLILISIIMGRTLYMKTRKSSQIHSGTYPRGMKVRYQAVPNDEGAPAETLKFSTIPEIFKVC